MAGVLFVTWDGGGNVPPALAIARELAERGTSTRFLGHESQRSAIESAGFPFEAYRHARPWSVLSERSSVSAPLAYAGVFTDRGIGVDLVESLQQDPADRLVIDGLLIGALDAAKRAGVPYLVLVHSLRGVVMRTLTSGPLALIMRLRGLDPRRLYAAAQGEIVTALRAFDVGAPAAPASAVYVGPVIPAVAAASVATSPAVVLVSLSTTYIQGQREVLQRLVDALAERPVQVIVTTGPAADPAELRVPPNAEVHRYVPHRELMPRASLVVGHGGHSTTMLALAHGLPVLVLPLNPLFDQPELARIVASHGAGLTLSRNARPRHLLDAVDDLLSDGTYRVRAERIGTQLRALDPSGDAADVVLRAGSAGR